MKYLTKSAFLCLFAVTLTGCLQHAKLAGRVIDLSGPVPEARVLGMIWIEDGDKAKPAPDIQNLKREERDAAYEKDMQTRGLPVAYVRAFADNSGRFELGNFSFSAETKKALKAMKQPRITRMTMWAFQRGYLSQALTAFPGQGEDVPYVTLSMIKPGNWKALYLDSTVDSLTLDYMVRGYSKEFGATKAEKSWILECMHANQWQAYTDSDIKGDKEMQEMCGHDYSDMVLSTSGIQRNPAHEKCGELLKRMGEIRNIEGIWIAHSRKAENPLVAARELLKQALSALPAGASEPKEYESMIFAGLEDEKNIRNEGAILRNGLNSQTWQDKAKELYGKGDKAAAYRALGRTIYGQLTSGIYQELTVVEISARVIPGIQENIAGFYQLMTRPLTAQLPGGDDGNHKDKPGYKVEESTETVALAAMTLDNLLLNLKGAKDNDRKRQYLGALYRFKPKEEKDVATLASLASENAGKSAGIEAAFRAMENVGAEDKVLAPAFFKLLDHKNGRVQYVAMEKCGELRSKAALPKMIEALKSVDKSANTINDEWRIRGLIAGLGKYGKDGLSELLKLRKNSGDEIVRLFVLGAIRAIDDRESLAQFMEIVRDSKSETDVRNIAIEMVGKLGAKEYMNELIGIYKAETNEVTQHKLIRSIGAIKSDDAILFLKNIIEKDAVVSNRGVAAVSLSRIGGKNAVVILKKALETETNAEARTDISYALEKLNN